MHGNDVELTGPGIVAVLRKIDGGGGAALECWTSAGRTFYCVTVCTDSGDKFCRNDAGALCQRPVWQRDNHVVAFGDELNRVLFEAAHGALVPYQLTLWFDRLRSQFHFGPRVPRTGLTGEPAWADQARASTSRLAVPFS